MDSALYDLAQRAGHALSARGWMLACAESCTGGWVSECVTMVPGSSAWFDRGFVTYTDAAKVEMLGVQEATLRGHGAVSEATVREMASGALARSHAQCALAVSGVAGPAGGTPDKPVGLVCIAWATQDGALRVQAYRFAGDREAVRRQSVVAALEGLIDVIRQQP
jgi:nicotinamide-nucleotide amidase